MKRLIQLFVRYSVWVNVVLVVITVFGLFSLKSMKTSFFAPIDPKLIKIQVVYPGASPSEIEEGVVLKIEDNLKGILGVDRTTSVSQENSAIITVEVAKNSESETVLNDVKNAVDKISSLPVGMEPAVVYKVPMRDFAFGFELSGDVPLKTLKQKAQAVERDLLALENISAVELAGFPDEEIEIAANSEIIRSYGITLDEIAAAIKQSNLDITGGKLKTKREELLIRSRTKSLDAVVIENYPIKALLDGRIIRIKDVAMVEMKWAENPARSFYNGKPSVSIRLFKSKDEDILSISASTRAYIEQFNQTHSKIQAYIVRDRSIVLKQRIRLLTKNGLTGFILVLLSLALFLNLRLSFWVALSVPISFLAMFIVGNLIGMTINVISLFGMIVVVGILVDDGIVIGENVFQRHEKGDPVYKAAVEGTMEVLPSVFFAVITTIVAFSPFFFLDGRIGDIMADMAAVVILTLSASLIEATLILPPHLAHSKALLKKRAKTRMQKMTDGMLNKLRHGLYEPVLRFSLENRLIVLLIPIALFMITLGALKGGVIKATFFPFIDADNITINLRMPAGTREDVTLKQLRRIEQAAWDVNIQFQSKRDDRLDVVRNVVISQTSESHIGNVNVTLLDGETRNMESHIFTSAIRKAVGTIYEAESVEYGNRSFFGKPISISLLSNNLDELSGAKADLKSELRTLPALKDVLDNDVPGAQEIHIALKEKARLVGLTERMILDQVRKGYFGIEAKRLQRGVDEIKIWVRLNADERASVGQIESLRIRSPQGDYYPLKSLANLTFKRSTMRINHLNSSREVKVEASLANRRDPVPPILNNIIDSILPPILKKYPSVRYSLEGQKRQTQKTQASARVVMPITLFLMFLIITLGFRSFAQAALVMILVPFGFIGMAWGHFIHGLSINLLSIFGFIALVGIIVNDSIVFTNTMNRLLRGGMLFKEAVFQTGLSRFRAILLTSLSTILGLGPLIFEKSRQAQFLIPMAVSVAYGLAFSTIIVLVMLPIGHLILNSLRQTVGRRIFRKKVTPESVEPAVKEIGFDIEKAVNGDH